jgi:hypothetical protein
MLPRVPIGRRLKRAIALVMLAALAFAQTSIALAAVHARMRRAMA